MKRATKESQAAGAANGPTNVATTVNSSNAGTSAFRPARPWKSRGFIGARVFVWWWWRAGRRWE